MLSSLQPLPHLPTLKNKNILTNEVLPSNNLVTAQKIKMWFYYALKFYYLATRAYFKTTCVLVNRGEIERTVYVSHSVGNSKSLNMCLYWTRQGNDISIMCTVTWRSLLREYPCTLWSPLAGFLEVKTQEDWLKGKLYNTFLKLHTWRF